MNWGEVAGEMATGAVAFLMLMGIVVIAIILTHGDDHPWV